MVLIDIHSFDKKNICINFPVPSRLRICRFLISIHGSHGTLGCAWVWYVISEIFNYHRFDSNFDMGMERIFLYLLLFFLIFSWSFFSSNNPFYPLNSIIRGKVLQFPIFRFRPRLESFRFPQLSLCRAPCWDRASKTYHNSWHFCYRAKHTNQTKGSVSRRVRICFSSWLQFSPE